jgi:hypothetical protein
MRLINNTRLCRIGTDTRVWLGRRSCLVHFPMIAVRLLTAKLVVSPDLSVPANTSCGCGSFFPAAKGWDPQTGWGYPHWPGLLKYFGS